MMDQVCTGGCPKKLMLNEKFLKDPPVKVWTPLRKTHEICENRYFEFEKYAISIFLMTASLGTIFSKSAN